MRRNAPVLATALIAALVLTGCDFLHRHFGRDENAYRQSVQEHPLEVPPGLDHPDTSGALAIPAPGTGSTGAPATTTVPQPGSASASSPAPTSAGSSRATAPVPPPTGPDVTVSGDGLRVVDTPDSTYTRVGYALERSGVAKVLSRDPAERSYAIETTGEVAQKPGLFKRIVTLGLAGRKAQVSVHLVVRIAADGSASRVSVQGDGSDAANAAARNVVAALRQRLS